MLAHEVALVVEPPPGEVERALVLLGAAYADVDVVVARGLDGGDPVLGIDGHTCSSF